MENYGAANELKTKGLFHLNELTDAEFELGFPIIPNPNKSTSRKRI